MTGSATLLGIGPSVSRVVPWVVPAKFRAGGDEFADQQSFGPGTEGNDPTAEQRRARPRISNGSAMPRPDSNLLADSRGKPSDGRLTDETGLGQTPPNMPPTTSQTAADDVRTSQRDVLTPPASVPEISAADPHGTTTETEIVNGVAVRQSIKLRIFVRRWKRHCRSVSPGTQIRIRPSNIAIN